MAAQRTPASGDPPIIMDDGGCTRIRQRGKRLTWTAGKTVINSAVRATKRNSIDSDGKTYENPVTGTINDVVLETATSASLKVTYARSATTLEVQSGYTVTETRDPRTGEYSYALNDPGAISNIKFNGGDAKTAPGVVYTMLHLKF